MATYYDVSLETNIPHGTDFLNRACTIYFRYPNGSYSDSYGGTAFAWLKGNIVRISSAYMNIDHSWIGANGGRLTLQTTTGQRTYAVNGFQRLP